MLPGKAMILDLRIEMQTHPNSPRLSSPHLHRSERCHVRVFKVRSFSSQFSSLPWRFAAWVNERPVIRAYHSDKRARRNAYVPCFSIWKSFVPFHSYQVFQRGAYYSVEVIPDAVAVISLNTMYFFDSNKGLLSLHFSL